MRHFRRLDKPLLRRCPREDFQTVFQRLASFLRYQKRILPREVRVDVAWAYGVHRYAEFGCLHGQRACQSEDRVFGCGVRGYVRVGNLGDRGGDVDDPAPSGSQHVGEKDFAAVVSPREIDAQDLFPQTIWHLKKTCGGSHAGVVDEDLYGAESTCDLLLQFFNRRFLGNVAYTRECFRPLAANLLSDGVERRWRSTDDSDAAFLRRKS